MRKRLELGADGLLRDRSGHVFGRLTSVVVEVYVEEERGVRGGEEVPSPVSDSACVGSDPQKRMEFSSDVVETTNADGGVGEDVRTVWGRYQTVIPSGKRYTLEEKRKQIIRNALKVRPLSRVLLAIDGLAASPFHNGQNERRKKYLGIQYALKGVGGEGNDERIDKMAELAGTASPLTHIPSAGHEMVRTRQRQVEAMLMHPGDANRRARGQSSEVYLREQFGLTATVEDGRVIWRRTGVSS